MSQGWGEGWAQILQALVDQDVLKQQGSPEAWGGGKGGICALDHSGLQNMSAKEAQWKQESHRGAARGMQVRDDGSEGAGM